MQIKQLSFEEWIKANPQVIVEEEDCEECGGDGEHECSCGHVHDCSFCKGRGKTGSERFYLEQYKKDQALILGFFLNKGTHEIA